MRYAPERLQAEIAYVAYHLHWPLDTLLDLEHGDRLAYVREARDLADARG